MENRKPFKSIDEQVEILRSRGMEVGDDARLILMREGYYSLVNGYKDAFIDRQLSSEAGEDRYKDGTKAWTYLQVTDYLSWAAQRWYSRGMDWPLSRVRSAFKEMGVVSFGETEGGGSR